MWLKKNNKNNLGFTLVELLVAISVVTMLLGITLANFRRAARSNDIQVAYRQVVDGIVTIRDYSLNGQVLADNTFPVGGYGIDIAFGPNPGSFTLYGADGDTNTLATGQALPNGATQFSNIKITQLCFLMEEGQNIQDAGLPCDNWPAMPPDMPINLELIFDLSGKIKAQAIINGNLDTNDDDVTYIAGVLEHQVSGQRAYFYISLVSGVVVGGLL